MSLYSYKKDQNTRVTQVEKRSINLEPKRKVKASQINMWGSASNSYGFLQKIVDASSVTNTLIPLFLIILGITFILKQIVPDLRYQYEEVNGYFAQGTTTPVTDDYIDLSKYIATPEGLDIVAKEALESGILQEDTLSKNYSGTFYLSIPALGMNKLLVTANVNSTNEASYLPILEGSLAHFAGTSLPISDVKNNTVIYGHSMALSRNPDVNSPMVAFSYLHKWKVGDDIYIEIDGTEYHYKMQSSKIVDPSDLSIITGSKGKQTLTLFTCHKPGDNKERYVAIARLVE